MSVISNRHSFVGFVSQGKEKSKPFDGQRLVKVTYREKSEKTSVCVSIPTIPETEIIDNSANFVDHIKDWLESMQDKMVRSLYESGRVQISDEEIELKAIIEWMDQESNGSRLTKEIIGKWFDDNLKEILIVAFAEKMMITDNANEEQMKRLEQVVNVYREKIASLAGGKTVFSAEIANKLLIALELGDSDDLMVIRFKSRFEKMKETNVVDMLGL